MLLVIYWQVELMLLNAHQMPGTLVFRWLWMENPFTALHSPVCSCHTYWHISVWAQFQFNLVNCNFLWVFRGGSDFMRSCLSWMCINQYLYRVSVSFSYHCLLSTIDLFVVYIQMTASWECWFSYFVLLLANFSFVEILNEPKAIWLTIVSHLSVVSCVTMYLQYEWVVVHSF